MEGIYNKLKVVLGDVTIAAIGEDFHYIFSYSQGGLESMVIRGKEWIYRAPRPTFWRALTDNDRGCNFHISSGIWLASDLFTNCVNTKVEINGEEIKLPFFPENRKYDELWLDNFNITFTYETIGEIKTTVDVSYKIDKNGDINVKTCFHKNEYLPELPVFGLRIIIPTIATGYMYEGLEGETYPDRYKGAERGIYKIKGMPITPYIRPQDSSLHIGTKNLTIYRNTTLNNADMDNTEFSLRIEKEDRDFSFSLIPYTASEIENAYHMEDLPPARRSVLCIYGKVRGVGGIDSWGSDVESEYHIKTDEDIIFSFNIIKGNS